MDTDLLLIGFTESPLKRTVGRVSVKACGHGEGEKVQKVMQHTSKQYSCPKILEWTGFIIASSSKTRSKASAALLGESRDSWEWDSLKPCINRVLGDRGKERGFPFRIPASFKFQNSNFHTTGRNKTRHPRSVCMIYEI